MRTVDTTIAALKNQACPLLPAPAYNGDGTGARIGLAVESMRRHLSSEGWELFAGLASAGYTLSGHGLPLSLTDVPSLLAAFATGVVVLQDKREWEGLTEGGGPEIRFTGVDALAERPDIFKLTVLKDAQNNLHYHRHSADEISCHAWVVYYNERVVKHIAPYVRSQHLVRTWHTVDKDIVPTFSGKGRKNAALLSGALGGAYPLRERLTKAAVRNSLQPCDVLTHPGYSGKGCRTPEFLHKLAGYKVAICTSSIYGYALRKIIEATVAGCRVITDLPVDEVMPEIDGNLTRVDPEIPISALSRLIVELAGDYHSAPQKVWATAAREWYDFRFQGVELARKIEQLRCSYRSEPSTKQQVGHV